MHILFKGKLLKNSAQNSKPAFLKLQNSGKLSIHLLYVCFDLYLEDIMNNYSNNKYCDTFLIIRCIYMLVNLYLVKNRF